MLVTQSVCCDVFDGDVWLDKYCAKIFAIGIFLRILTGIDSTRPILSRSDPEPSPNSSQPPRILNTLASDRDIIGDTAQKLPGDDDGNAADSRISSVPSFLASVRRRSPSCR